MQTPFKPAIAIGLVAALVPAARADEATVLPDLKPVDVNQNMEKWGYKTTKDLAQEAGPVWMRSKKAGDVLGADGVLFYSVDAYGNNAATVRRVNAVVAATKKAPRPVALPELLVVASLPYKGAEPKKAQEWVRQNIGRKAKTTIGGVTFELDTPADTSRSLSIYNAEA